MTHFGIISPPVAGHIHPFAALGRELISRGHRVTYLQMVDLEQKIRSEGIDFEPIGLRDHPRGSLPQSLAQLGQLAGQKALKFTIQAVARTSVMVCRDAPEAIRRLGIDALLVDQMEPAGGAVADHAGVPFFTVCNALPVNRDRVAPPAFAPWAYRQTWWAPMRNVVGYAVSDWMTRPIARVVADYRKQWKLPPLASADDSFSKRAQICQMPRAFDFPREGLAKTFHYVGPLRRAKAEQVPFPWERLDGRPIVYGSLGTLQGAREHVFRCFAEASDELNMQLVISHGGGLTPAQAARLPGNPIVVPYAPQEELLRRAQLTFTHAGLNTVLDSMTYGVPMVAVPITFEQPAIARRVERAGVGASIPLPQLTARSLRTVAFDVAHMRTYRENASLLQRGISECAGVLTASDIIEKLMLA
jgi:zeaxanthin glucosyltransferase